MRALPTGLGIVLSLAGAVWVLQGINVLPGSFMTGQAFWAFTGVVCLVLGSGLLFLGLRGAGPRDG
ncbi:MAG TPA: hypothetical protein VGE04_10460 [Chloroflexia bacterium]